MPNFLICLAHFCEIHGPSTIICTQRQDTPVPLQTNSKLSVCGSCALHLPNEATTLVTPAAVSSDTPDLEDGRNSPSSLASGPSPSYVSTRYPPSQKVYTSLMKLVMKCLSVETVADSQKPLFFGDGTNGFCLSKVFGIPDAHARGGERKYALLAVCDSEKHLLQRWDIASTYITEMILLIQKLVNAHLEESKSHWGDNERYLRRLKVAPRSLAELTNDNEIFVKFHLCGIEMLRDVA